MRLTCPNCDAEYEVDDAAIPKDGRDVQCSACGHAWFQTHPDLDAAAEAEAALYEAPDGAAPAGGPAEPGADADELAQGDETDGPGDGAAADRLLEDEDWSRDGGEAGPEAATALPSAAARGLDETVLAVLKEEAAREVAARQTEAAGRPGLESQTEMPLAAAPSGAAAGAAGGSMAAAVKRIARLRGVAADAEDEAGVEAEAGAGAEAEAAEVAQPARSRRNSLPAIEEINQSLRATAERVQDGEDAVAETLAASAAGGRGGFRRGFVLLVGLAVLGVVLYTFAPLIAAKVPALEGAAQGYVAAVDAGRIWLDELLRGLIAQLKALMGNQSA